MKSEDRCVWCGRDGREVIEIALETTDRLAWRTRVQPFVVHREHEAAFRGFCARVASQGRRFLLAIAALVAAIVAFQIVVAAGGVAVGLAGIGLSVVLLGGLLIALPIATPETVRLVGVLRAVRLVRIAGAVVCAVGLVVLGLAVT
jgi:hypothetical protein